MDTLSKKPQERPAEISAILSSLDRYNPEKIAILQEYATTQCADQHSDIEANLALLKLLQFQQQPNPNKEDIICNILSMALANFLTSDFTTALHVLPSYVLDSPAADTLAESVQKLFHLYTLLDGCRFPEFWAVYERDDAHADITADVADFENLVRMSITRAVDISSQAIHKDVFRSWLNLSDNKFADYVQELGWKVEGETVEVPANKENEAKPATSNESIKIEQISRLLKRTNE
ncbi:Eukaryotic translation initiation factor 3 subunit K [Yarrowia sp. B02]|nr:Eukaryotic translation initiation factor 3 subunit K [Yarrowia sp. B02]